MKLHEREQIVREVETKLNLHLVDTMLHSDLTYGEQLRVLSEVYGGFIARLAKYMIREERHGDTNRPGGLAPAEKPFDDSAVEAFVKESEPPPPDGEAT